MIGHAWVADKEREVRIAEAVRDGAAAFGDKITLHSTSEPAVAEGDFGVFFAIKKMTHFKAYEAAGVPTVLLDKALIRNMVGNDVGSYFRVSLNSRSPLSLMGPRPSERFERLGIALQPRRPASPDGAVIFAGQSNKYFGFFGLGDVNDYAEKVLARVAELASQRKRIYRPKPSFTGYRKIAGAALSRPPETMQDLLRNAHAVITHGSSAAIDAIFAGVPAIMLGDGVAAPASGRSVEDVVDPPFPSGEDRYLWACGLAWCQWTMAEMRSGEMWSFIRPKIMAGKA